MNTGNISFDMAKITTALDNEDRSTASTAILHDKLRDSLFYSELKYISPSIGKNVEILKEIQIKHDQIEAEFFKEKEALQAKYQKLYQPLYAQRYQVVNGLIRKNEESMDAEYNEATGIPNFWLTAMKNNEVLAEEIFDKDEGALGYLKDIQWSKIENAKGFKLEFFFNTNPYFKNSNLTKVYYMIDEEEPIFEKATGTKIDWYPGKCLSQIPEQDGSIASKLKERESFFDFFSPPPIPARREDIDDNTAEKLKKQMEHDYDVGMLIREKIIPRAISWFMGEAHDVSYDITDNEDDDDDLDYDDDEDDKKDYIDRDSDEYDGGKNAMETDGGSDE